MIYLKYSYDQPLKVLISGASGFIGTALKDFLELAGHNVWELTREKKRKEEKTIVWDRFSSKIHWEKFEGFDVVINLAGENISRGWWTDKKKASILDSRYKGTKHLVKILKNLKQPCKTFINASAIGIYGDRGNEILTEESALGDRLFLTKVCKYWEQAAFDLESKGIRVVCARFGMVLSPKGGALKKLLPFFRIGIGAKMGCGSQYMSWIALDDLMGALYHILMTPTLSGPVNCTSPHPATNAYFSKKLAAALSRSIGPPLPSFIIKLFFGQKGEELFLTSTRVQPKKLLESGYHFQFPSLQQVFRNIF